ncbi:hypothetical protein [Kamptonema formosum]|nr:hypothetical protein [Oscillatoria sp. PCC 10802]
MTTAAGEFRATLRLGLTPAASQASCAGCRSAIHPFRAQALARLG